MPGEQMNDEPRGGWPDWDEFEAELARHNPLETGRERVIRYFGVGILVLSLIGQTVSLLHYL